MPIQFDTPEQDERAANLWWKVLEASVKDAVYVDAWLRSDSTEVGSFLWVCEYLGTDPAYWRRLVTEERLKRR